MRKCSCNVDTEHVIIERRSFDGVVVRLWSSGRLTKTMLNVWIADPIRDAKMYDLYMKNLITLMDNVCVLDVKEVGIIWKFMRQHSKMLHPMEPNPFKYACKRLAGKKMVTGKGGKTFSWK